MIVLVTALAALVLGSWVYCVLQVIAAARYRAVPARRPDHCEPVSILKPLHGLDAGLESNLRTFFTQDYPVYEILFAARDAADPCWQAVERLRAEFPHIPARTFVTGDPPYPNAKVFSLSLMAQAAAHDLLLMSDSDIRVDAGLVRTVAAEFSDPGLGVATCPYRAVPGHSFWSTLEAVGMNTEFWGGAFTARLVEGGVRFAVGPTLAARRRVLESIGGFARLSRYLAEDFVLGRLAAEAGFGVILSRYIVEHHIGSQPLRANCIHRLRWNRSTRRSRPAGYVGQVFTNPLPLALLLTAAAPGWWPVLLPALALRALAAAAVSQSTLHDPLCRRRWYLVPLQDLLSFAFWLAGFFGNTIEWRGCRYYLQRDGAFRLLPPRP